MTALILAAGYATRLYPLTLDRPKPLLPIGDKPIIDYIMQEILTLPVINQVVVVTNSKFYHHFTAWEQKSSWPVSVTIIDDGTDSDENKRGAIGDILFAIEQIKIQEDLLVIAGDNFFTYPLLDFYNFYQLKGSDCVCVKKLTDMEALKQFGVCEMDEQNRIIGFEEKPQQPKSDLVAFASYFYQKETLPLFQTYENQGNKLDAPGHFLAWLYKEKALFGYVMQGDCYDIGTHKAYEEVQQIFGKSEKRH